MKVFAKRGINPKGTVLSLADFKLFSDIENQEYNPSKMADIIKKAEEYLDKEIKVIPLSSYREYLEKGRMDTHSSLYYARPNGMFYLGVAEWYENKGRFTEKLIDYIWSILEETTWVLPEHTWHFPNRGTTNVPPIVGDRVLHGLELAAIYQGATLALVYKLNEDKIRAFSAVVADRIVYELKKRIIFPYLNCRFTWEGDYGNKVNNWCPWNISNILLVVALIEEDMYNRERTVTLALQHLDNFISWYKEDGGCDEGPTYWGHAGGSLFDCLETLSDLTDGKISVYDEPIIKAMGEYLAKFSIAGRHFVNFADSHSTAAHDGYLLRRYGEKCGSEVLASFGDVMASYMSASLAISHPYRALKSLLYPPVKREDVVAKAAKSCFFPDLKVMIERESENPEEGLFLAIKGGNNGESHNHNDVGSFVVYYNGKPVLIDAGVGGYTRQTFSPQRYELWFMQSRYHNLPMFDDVGQMQGGAYASENEVYDPEERSFTLNIEGAYRPEVGVKSLRRYARMGDGEITVRDEITLDSEKLITFCFMTHRVPTVEGNRVLLTEGRVLEFENDKLNATIEEFDPVGMNTESAWGTDKLWRIRLETRAEGGSFTFTIR
ncbi:MAG: heparinase II/III-family protein [Clostridia bacterium]|nr:heparinase II/III-family protein [Clostridia bacterium]